MQYPEPPTKIYKPHPADPARTAALTDSNAPVRIYPPPAAK